MKKIIYTITVFLTMCFGLNAYTLRENVKETLSKREVKQSIIDETSDFLLDSRGEMSIIPQQDEIDSLIAKAEMLLKKDRNNIVIKQYLSTMYLKKGGNKNTLKAQKINEENLKDKGITDFERWSVTGLYYYQIGEKKKAQTYFNKIKEKYKDKPAVYNLIEIVTMDIDMLKDSTDFNEFMVNTATNEKKMTEMQEIAKKQVEKIKIVKDFFQTEENKREFGVVDELVYSFDLLLNLSKINEIMQKDLKQAGGFKTKTVKEATDYYLKNVANNEKMTEDSIKYSIILENMYLRIISTLVSADEKESTDFSNKLEKSKLYEIMRKLEE
ncbi:hypothetical protein JMUB3935_0567 [Leptotrichia trevisanii]|uniref:Tetratricopeptide repeat protein n=1 Tax=Leptotrichia trevisanii TaxID=109328 RepID=A0A510KIU0_9FUSO|nr:hypothetical protein [Leptotrichia trevisanii]BBM51600.1 hypothetical protein JMUB3935_0567 [Leptotrichia trevisanii]